ncbi:glutathione S-transferase [Circinella umbellata]|nr:glutathione S-transferase [Circinella umbellata]
MTLTSHVKLTYFNFGTLGIGEPIKLLLQDSGTSHEYIRVEMDEWPKGKTEFIEKGLIFGTLPFVELDGKYLGGCIPLMRLLSKKLGGKYQGSTDEEEYLVDMVADFCIDWRGDVNRAMFSKDMREKYITEQKAQHQERFERAYGLNDGPYLLGQNISYADFVVYHNLVNDGQRTQGLEQYPNLAKFIKAFEERPNLKEYVATFPEIPAYVLVNQ